MELSLGLGLGHRHFTSSAPPVFSPASIPDLALWLDAAEASSITAAAGAVSQWSDKSGNGYHAVQSSSGARPKTATRSLNSLNVIEFDGSDDGFNVSPVPDISGAHTMFVVAATDTPTKSGNQNFIRGLNSTSTRQQITYGGSGTTLLGRNGSSDATYSLTVDSNPHIFSQACYATDLRLYYAGGHVASSTASGGGTTNLGIGRRGNSGDSPLDGYIAEVLIYGRALNSSEANQVGNYLASKWNVTWTDYSYSTLAVIGDSITAGQSASTSANRWANIVATSLGTPLLNQGISGTYLQNTILSGGSPGANNGRDRYIADVTSRNRAERVVILYGVNDARDAPIEANLTLANFINDYQEMITGLLAAGYTQDKITLGSPPYFTGHRSGDTGGAARLASFAGAVRDLAVANHVKFADVYNYMINNGGASLLSGDYLHPNDSGHAAIAVAILAADFVS